MVLLLVHMEWCEAADCHVSLRSTMLVAAHVARAFEKREVTMVGYEIGLDPTCLCNNHRTMVSLLPFTGLRLSVAQFMGQQLDNESGGGSD